MRYCACTEADCTGPDHPPGKSCHWEPEIIDGQAVNASVGGLCIPCQPSTVAAVRHDRGVIDKVNTQLFGKRRARKRRK
jgi:hypothetical protein